MKLRAATELPVCLSWCLSPTQGLSASPAASQHPLCRLPPPTRPPQSVSLLPRGARPLFTLTQPESAMPEKAAIHPPAPSSSDGSPEGCPITRASSVLAHTLLPRRPRHSACGGPHAPGALGGQTPVHTNNTDPYYHSCLWGVL